MSMRSSVLVRLGLCAAATFGMLSQTAVAAGLINTTAATPAPITQTATLPLTPTNFSSNGNVQGNPISINKFDTLNDSRILDSVTLTVHALIRNDFGMKFYTPATITTSVATGDTNQPGPSITLYQPDGKTPLLTAAAANDPSVLSRSVTWGNKPGQSMPQEFSSSLSPSSPYYIAPAISEKTQTLKLTSAADLALFSGSGSLALPVAGSAWAKITSSSGNGYGNVSTQGTADVTVTYNYHDRIPAPQTVPEPAAVVLWSLGGVAFALGYRARRKPVA